MTAACPTCGRHGRCNDCCCVHPDHLFTRIQIKVSHRAECSLCKHPLVPSDGELT